MAKGSWIAVLAATLVLHSARRVVCRGGEARPFWWLVVRDKARILGVDARPEPGRTFVRIETTSPSVNFISYTKNPTTFIVGTYTGLELGGSAIGNLGRESGKSGPCTSSTRRASRD